MKEKTSGSDGRSLLGGGVEKWSTRGIFKTKKFTRAELQGTLLARLGMDTTVSPDISSNFDIYVTQSPEIGNSSQSMNYAGAILLIS